MLEGVSFVDLTHNLDKSIPTWSGGCGFHHEIKKDYDQGVRVMTFKMHAGLGTHMDAPSHFVEGSKNIGELELEQLIIPLCIIDVSDRCSADLKIGLNDFKTYEKMYGQIKKGSLVVGNTGWSRYWNDSNAFRNLGKDGLMHFPTFHEEVANLLMEREIAGLGIDTLSPDPQGGIYPLHQVLLGTGKYIIENLANLDRVPPKGAFAIVLPPKIMVGSEAPIRAVALIKGE